MNPAVHLGDHDVRQYHDIFSGAIPTITFDHTLQQFFSQPFGMDDIGWAKDHLLHQHTKVSPGLDKLSYQTVVEILNEALLALFNGCIDNLDAPQIWFTTVLVRVLKLGKPAMSLNSYRLVGLECCLIEGFDTPN